MSDKKQETTAEELEELFGDIEGAAGNSDETKESTEGDDFLQALEDMTKSKNGSEDKTKEETSTKKTGKSISKSKEQSEEHKRPISTITPEGEEKPYVDSLLNNFKEPNYDKILEELKGYGVRLSETPTPQLLGAQIAKVQAQRDRVSQILVDTILNTRGIKRLYEIAFDREIITREERSQEQRTAQVHNKHRQLYDAFKRAKDHEIIVKQIYDNLRATHESISRQITVLQMELQLHGKTEQALSQVKPDGNKGGKVGWGDIGRK